MYTQQDQVLAEIWADLHGKDFRKMDEFEKQSYMDELFGRDYDEVL